MKKTLLMRICFSSQDFPGLFDHIFRVIFLESRFRMSISRRHVWDKALTVCCWHVTEHSISDIRIEFLKGVPEMQTHTAAAWLKKKVILERVPFNILLRSSF